MRADPSDGASDDAHTPDPAREPRESALSSVPTNHPVGIPSGHANWLRMSATVDVVRMHSHSGLSSDSGEADGGGVVVPLPNQRMTASSGLGVISPELALVDPELARAARALLPDPAHATPPRQPLVAPVAVEHAFLERVRGSLEPEPTANESLPRRSRTSPLAAVGLVATAALLAFLVRYDWRAAPEQQNRAAASPTLGRPAPAPETPPAGRDRTDEGPVEPAPATPAPTPSTQSERQPEPPPPAPTTPAPATTAGQTFVWVAAPATTAYEFQLFRGSERIFRARARAPRLELPGRWRQNGRTYALTPGSYRWYVWPISRRTKRPAAVAIVQARLVIQEESR